MILYHFTRRDNIPSIMRDGLNKGDIGRTFDEARGLNGVWLTTDPRPEGHGIGPRLLTEDERAYHGAPLGAHYPNRFEMRIKIKLSNDDPLLHRWLDWSSENVEDDFREDLIRRGGKQKAKSWYIYLATITHNLFENIVDIERSARVQRQVNKLNSALALRKAF